MQWNVGIPQDEQHRAEIISVASAAANCLWVKRGISQSLYLLLPDLGYSIVLCAGLREESECLWIYMENQAVALVGEELQILGQGWV